MAKKIDLNGLDHFKEKENAMIASEYSSSKTYAVGDYCYHAGTLYCCTTAITTAENWMAGHWTAAKLADDISAFKTVITGIYNVIPKSSEWEAEDFTINSGYYDRSGVQKASNYANFASFTYTGKTYKVTCNQMPNNQTQVPIVYLDSNGGLVGVEPSDSSTSMTDYILTVPSGTATIIVNFTVNNTLYVYTQNIDLINCASLNELNAVEARLPFVNVKEYGAKGDGTTNDRSAIQSALNAVEASGGGTVFFPYGVYNLIITESAFAKSYLYIPSNTKLLFEKGATIKRGDSYSAHILMSKNESSATLYNGAHDIIIDGATIDAGGGADWATSICLSHTDNVCITNCIFKNGAGVGHYIEVNSSRFVRVIDCDFQPSQTMAMYIQIEEASGHGNAGQNDNTPSYDVTILRCRFNKGTASSMAICSENDSDLSHDIRISGCSFNGGANVNGYIKFTLGITNVDIYENTFNIGETSSCGVKIDDSTGSCTVHDNRFGNFVTAISGSPVQYNNMINGTLTNP